MMVQFSSSYRSTEAEIMDNFDLHGAEMQQLLTDLKVVNTYLGGTRVTLSGIERLLRAVPADKEITLLDVGCGDGEMLRQCAQYFHKRNRTFRGIGVDANPFILKEAQQRSSEYDCITYQELDVFAEETTLPSFDIACCTLFLHHFPNDKIVQLLNRLLTASKLGIVVNDLSRNWWAFKLFSVFSSLFLKSSIAKHDGLVSVARGFKKQELIAMSDAIPGTHTITGKWAFRYQWLIENV